MNTATKIELMVETMICGNSIKESPNYSNWLDRIKLNDIRNYANFTYDLKVYGSKLEMLNQIKDHLTNRERIKKCY